VLVVDDDRAIRGFVAEVLMDEGYDVKTAENGNEALAVSREWHPDLIVLDLMMPVMDGWTFRARQRQEDALADVPVVVTSAATTLRTHRDTLEPCVLLPKPFELEELLGAVESCTPRQAC
jgi:DNA-binding response OmpR family regulator